MKVCLAGQSAIRWWQTEGIAHIRDTRRKLPPNFTSDYTEEDVANLMEKYQLRGRLEVFAPSGTRRVRRKGVMEHSSKYAADKRWFHQISSSIWVCSPELALFQSLRGKKEIEGILIASKAFCAYHPDTKELSVQITTPRQCMAVLSSMHNVCNYSIAHLAISHAASNAYSPREIQAHLLLCTPRRLGGFGLPKSQLNAEIQLSDAEDEIALRVDQLWEEQKVVLEYDSDMHHANAKQLNIDSRRRALLANDGYLTLTMTNNQMKYSTQTTLFANALAKALRVNIKFTSKDYLQRIDRFRNAVLNTDLL